MWKHRDIRIRIQRQYLADLMNCATSESIISLISMCYSVIVLRGIINAAPWCLVKINATYYNLSWGGL